MSGASLAGPCARARGPLCSAPLPCRPFTMRHSLLAAALLSATLAACQGQAPTTPAEGTAATAASTEQADAKFADTLQALARRLAAPEPGERDADRRPPLRRRRSTTLSAAGRQAQLDFNKKLLAELDAIDASKRSRARTRSTLRSCATSCAATSGASRRCSRWAWDPQVYNGLAGGAIYNLMAREFAPMPRAPEVGDRAHGEDPGAVRADAREPRPGARAEDPRRDRGEAERRRAQPRRHLHHARTPTSCRARTASASTPPSPACARPSPSSRQWLDKTLVPNAKGDFRIGQKLYDEKLQFALMSSLSRAEIKQRAEAELKRVRARDVRHRAQRAEGQAGRAGDAGRRRATSSSRRRSKPRSNSPTPTARSARTSSTSPSRRWPRRPTFAREKDLVTVPDAPVQDHPDAGIPARRVGGVLRFARPARQGPGHLLRDLADPGRLDARSRSIRSCANTTAA